VRAFLALGVTVLLTACGKGLVLPGSGAPDATPQELASLHAGNQRLAAKLVQHEAATKKLPENLEQLKAWATAEKTWEPDDERSLTDPWGNALVLGVIPIGRTTFTLRSSGPDKKEKTSDDLYYDSRDKGTKTFKERNG
jgi:hypothetical protein